jgi:hypothetical protein
MVMNADNVEVGWSIADISILWKLIFPAGLKRELHKSK